MPLLDTRFTFRWSNLGSRISNGEVINEEWIIHHFDFQTFPIFGFIDDLALPMARPGNSASIRQDFSQDIQFGYYSGYLRLHCLKAQVIYFPIGIIGAVFITQLDLNDNGVQIMSGLNDYLVELLSGFLVGGLFPCLYVDGIFWVLTTMLPCFLNPSPRLHLLNVRLSSLKECIEHGFCRSAQ